MAIGQKVENFWMGMAVGHDLDQAVVWRHEIMCVEDTQLRLFVDLVEHFA